MSALQTRLREEYPWTVQPLIASGPMRPYATAALASAVSLSGGLGLLSFIPERTDRDLEELHSTLAPITSKAGGTGEVLLPVGIGYLLHSAPFETARAQISAHRPAVVWLFAPGPASNATSTLGAWAGMVRAASPGTRVWVQVGSVADALAAVDEVSPNREELTLVAQGLDAGGHGLAAGAGIVSLVPETKDALAARGRSDVAVLAAGGIVDGRGGAAAMALGADGFVLGSRLLASEEIAAPAGFREGILAAVDGGQSTVRTQLFDRLRGTKLGGENGWPLTYDGRGLRNLSSRDDDSGVPFGTLKEEFDLAQKENRPERFGVAGRDVTYVGTGVGLIKNIMPAKSIVDEVRTGAISTLQNTYGHFKHLESERR